MDLDRNCIDGDESHQNIIDDESTDNDDASLRAVFEELGKSHFLHCFSGNT